MLYGCWGVLGDCLLAQVKIANQQVWYSGTLSTKWWFCQLTYHWTVVKWSIIDYGIYSLTAVCPDKLILDSTKTLLTSIETKHEHKQSRNNSRASVKNLVEERYCPATSYHSQLVCKHTFLLPMSFSMEKIIIMHNTLCRKTHNFNDSHTNPSQQP